MIVDLAVEDDADVAFGIPHRLGSARDIHHREASAGEEHRQMLVGKITLAVRPAMADGVGHGAQDPRIARADEAADAAHSESSDHSVAPVPSRYKATPGLYKLLMQAARACYAPRWKVMAPARRFGDGHWT